MPKANTVMTVLGPIPTSQLGATFSHEHLIAAPTGWESNPNLQFDYEVELVRAIENMNKLRSLGISTIIDPIPMDLGRKVEFMADVSAGSGMNIVCATGLYFETGYLAGLPTYYRMRSAEEITAIYVKEITDGIGPKKVRPGVIKCATSANEIRDNERKALTAAGRASKATGIPITTHTQEGTMGPEQLDIFEAQGVDPRCVTIGHCSDTANLSYLVKVLKRGAFIGFDRVGIEAWTDDHTKIGVLAGLLAMGYEKQIVLSHDNVGCYHGFRPRPPDPKRRYTLIHEEFLPRLKTAGIGDKAIHTMLVENPRRYFEGP